MEFTAEMIAEFLGGEVVGDKEAKVSTLCKIEEGEPGALAFLSNPKYESHIYDTEASIVIVNQDFTPSKPVKSTLIRVENAYAAFAKLLELYNSMKPQKTGVSPLAFVSSSATLGKGSYIGEYVVIGENVTIGKNAKIYPLVYIGDDVVIGDDVIIHAGAVIGADGFGFAPQADGTYQKIPQIGNVVIEDRVEIGANACVDRATMGSTIVRAGAKLDDLVMVAHNVVVGENTVFASQVGIAGSTKIGRNCMFGGQVGVAGHITIADGTQIASQSGVANSIKTENQKLMGSPAYDASSYQRAAVVFKELPEMRRKLAAMEKEIARLKEALNE